MALRQNVAFRNMLAAAFGAAFNGGSIQIRTGSQPADPATAAPGTLLATITLPGSPFAAAANGAIAKSGTWSTPAIASGTAGWARMFSSDSLQWIDLAIGAEMTIDNASIVSGGTVTVLTFAYTTPSGI